MAFNYGNSNNQIPRPDITEYERVGHLSLGGPSSSQSQLGTSAGLHGYSPEYDNEIPYHSTVPLKHKSPDEFTDDEDQPIIKKLFTGEKVNFYPNPNR